MNRPCSVAGCDAPVRVHGLCNRHWLRLRKHGDVETVKRPPGRPPSIRIGDPFTFWTVIGAEDQVASGRRYLCRCRCGTERPVAGSNLKSGASRSCGCKPTRCVVCGASLAGRRFDAETCSAACRRERSRLRRLREGKAEPGYDDLAAYLGRKRRKVASVDQRPESRQRRAKPPQEQNGWNGCRHAPAQRADQPWRCSLCGVELEPAFDVPGGLRC
jgi:hypothetical protein